jgi:hypothetical protein
MTYDEFITEYYKVSARAVQLSERSRREGLLAIEDAIDFDKLKQRDIFEYGLRFAVDGIDSAITKDILANIIMQEKDAYTRLIMQIKMAAILSIKEGEGTLIVACKMNSFTDIAFTDDRTLEIEHWCNK